MWILPWKTSNRPREDGVTLCYPILLGGYNMDSNAVFEKVKSLIAEKLEIEDSKITLDSYFRKDLGADSLDTYELVYAIEEEMGVSIPDEKANEFETVRDAVDFLAKLLK